MRMTCRSSFALWIWGHRLPALQFDRPRTRHGVDAGGGRVHIRAPRRQPLRLLQSSPPGGGACSTRYEASRHGKYPQHRHHRPRRSRQDHARRLTAEAIRHLPRQPARVGGTHHGLDGPRTGKGHHHPRQERRLQMEGLPHQHRRHPRPRRLRRRSRAHHEHDRRRAARGGRARWPAGADAFRSAQGARNGAKPIVVINKIDRENARPHKVLDQVFELFVELNATDEQLDFPVVYASAKNGYAMREDAREQRRHEAALRRDRETHPAADERPSRYFQLLVSNLDYSDYLGRIALGASSAAVSRSATPSFAFIATDAASAPMSPRSSPTPAWNSRNAARQRRRHRRPDRLRGRFHRRDSDRQRGTHAVAVR